MPDGCVWRNSRHPNVRDGMDGFYREINGNIGRCMCRPEDYPEDTIVYSTGYPNYYCCDLAFRDCCDPIRTAYGYSDDCIPAYQRDHRFMPKPPPPPPSPSPPPPSPSPPPHPCAWIWERYELGLPEGSPFPFGSPPPYSNVNKCGGVTENSMGASGSKLRDYCETSYYQKPDCRDVKCVWDPDAGSSGKCVEGDIMQCGRGLTYSSQCSNVLPND
jgi:hypothetical protein